MIEDEFFKRQLKGSARTFFESADLAIIDALKGHYPSISQKDIEALHSVFWTRRDLTIPYYIEILSRMVDHSPTFFASESEAGATIEDLLSRGLVRKKIYWGMCGTGHDDIIRANIGIHLQPAIERELLDAVSELEYRSVLQYFPKDRESTE